MLQAPHGLTIRRLEPSDLPFVVDQHLQYFPEGFFARLGPRFLTDYYLSYCTDLSACAVVAVDGEEAIGFLVGTPDPAGHRQHLLHAHGRPLIREAVRALIRRPRLAALFLRTRAVRYARKLALRHRRPASPPAAGPSGQAAVLSHLVVTPGHQGRGIATALVEELEVLARAAGCDRLELVTEASGQGAAYYERTGWRSMGQHRTPDGTLLIKFARSLPDPDATEGSTDSASN